MTPPFAVDPGAWLRLLETLADGAVYGAGPDAPAHDRRAPPLLTLAWLEEPPGTALAGVVEEDLARGLSAPGSVLIDYEEVTLGALAAVRTFALHRGPAGLPTASEQWRLLAAGRRCAVTAMTALADQPEWGPALAAVAATLTPAP